ncbi:ribosomal protein subunit Mrp10 [Schizosaccharomyces cryophilus OY26]|uniref:Ribosomal protein subunit Mrp10 n=1 Tax=Schizosaccharomyces cryophilus (strain OY26 / ATCC MYA-4695 / CBS 11777 / NBRC 106824 / NRRL Y48691) TaxID=653667 RepID=S9XI69_SCHCR|nr:ribosomal protein subunit Mrp10 [Schizosaccharomyces cryophilus OY26]EPY53341.1 ribosomal protein subunit Mrp10 [Schizosaccharomyces cryophilus OY26]
MSRKVVNAPRLQGLSRLRVRPKKERQAIPCSQEMAALLGCWQNNSGNTNSSQCLKVAASLENCMKSQHGKQKSENTINYHLARLGKLL